MEPSPLIQRNIIILGDSRSGKSTIANKILGTDRDLFKVNDSFLNSSQNHEEQWFRSITVIREINKKQYKITVTDGMSFNSESFCIRNIRSHCNCNDIDEYNLIIFVIKADRISRNERHVLDSKISLFVESKLKSFSALVISHCEKMSDDVRSNVLEEFKSDSYLRKFANLMQMGIKTTGIPSPNEFEATAYDRMKDKIKYDEAQLAELVVNAENSVEVNDLLQIDYNCKCSVM